MGLGNIGNDIFSGGSDKFTTPTNIQTIDPPPIVKTARKQLEDFIEGQPFGTAPDIPTREIAGTSPLQQELQRIAGEQVTGGDFGISADAFREAAQRGTDVATSPEFEGLRRQIDDLRTQEQTAIRQRGELGGQLKSTPTQAVEAESAQKFDTFLLQEFSRLQRQNQQDKLQAAAGLSELGTRRLGDVAAVNQIVDQERAIEQARNDAVYQQAISTVLFPYEQQLRLFNVALGQEDDVAITGGGPTDLGFLVQAFAGAAASA